MTVTLADARDAAQQVVTARLHGDADTAEAIAREFGDPLILALVLADLVLYVHTRWGRDISALMGINYTHEAGVEGWQALAAAIESWREEVETR